MRNRTHLFQDARNKTCLFLRDNLESTRRKESGIQQKITLIKLNLKVKKPL